MAVRGRELHLLIKVNNMIIGLAGRKQSGKTLAAQMLVGDFGYNKISFADPLRTMLCDFLRRFGIPYSNAWRLLTIDKEEIIEPIGKSGRQLLQTLGTEWGRNLVHPDVWVMAMNGRTSHELNYVFDDIRFENEASFIREMGGIMIHVQRDAVEQSGDYHASEAGIRFLPGDIRAENNASIDAFIDAIKSVVDSVNEQKYSASI